MSKVIRRSSYSLRPFVNSYLGVNSQLLFGPLKRTISTTTTIRMADIMEKVSTKTGPPRKCEAAKLEQDDKDSAQPERVSSDCIVLELSVNCQPLTNPQPLHHIHRLSRLLARSGSQDSSQPTQLASSLKAQLPKRLKLAARM